MNTSFPARSDSPVGFRGADSFWLLGMFAVLVGLTAADVVGPARLAAQPPVEAGQPADEVAEGDYIPATELLPESTAGLIRIPHFPTFCTAWDETNLGRLLDDPSLEPFVEAQQEQAESYFDSLDTKVGLKPQDLYDIASGEVVAAWLPFSKDNRRPYAVVVIADTRGRRGDAEAALEKVDADLKAQGATRKDQEYGGQTVRIYSRKPKPGQLKIEEIALTVDDDRVIAADRDSAVFDLIDAAAGQPKGEAIQSVAEYQTVMSRSRDKLAPSLQAGSGVLGIEWFARPFQMGRILRELFEVDRGNQVDILRLLENQGFNAILAAGGVVGMGVGEFDVLHRGLILAPPTTGEPGRYELAARMLQFPNAPLDDIPAWVIPDAARFTRFQWKMEEAFWAAETLVNEAFGDEIFRPMIEGIRDDEEGPQVDLAKDVLPNLDNEAILITENELPATTESERMLVAIRVKQPEVIRRVVQKVMEVEPDVTTIETVPGVRIWVVDRDRQPEQDFDSDLFADLGFEEPADVEEPPPLLNQWAIALVDEGPGSEAPYLMFSSHPELLVDIARRIGEGAAAGLGGLPQIQRVTSSMKQLGADEVAFQLIVRPRLSLRVKYELLRKGELKNIDSVGASLLRRVFAEDDAAEEDEFEAGKLPPLGELEQYLQPGGSYVESIDDGWTMTGFLLEADTE